MSRRRLLLLVLAAASAAPHVRAQDAPPRETPIAASIAAPVWSLVADGQTAAWAPRSEWTPDSLASAARDALAWLRRRGHAAARLDSAVVDSLSARLFASTGAARRLAEVRIEGAAEARLPALRRALGIDRGDVFADTAASAAAARLLAVYADAGNPLASVAIDVDSGGERLVFRVDEGEAVVLDSIAIVGSRTRAAFAGRVMGVETGQTLRGFRPDRLARRLEETGLFRRVDAPTLSLDADGRATLQVRVEEAPPGAFDLVLGLLPPPSGRGRAQLIGTGSLALRNLFGAGYGLAVRLDRLPGTAATATARVSSLYPRGWPLRLEAAFDGLTQDSTLTSQRYRAEGGLFVGGAIGAASGVEIVGLVTLDRTRPGLAGSRFGGGGGVAGDAQRVARTDAAFSGLGLRVVRVDDRLDPRRGVTFEVTGEVGRRERAFGRIDAVDGGGLNEVRVRERVRQERAEAHLRLYVPTLRRQSLAVGLDGRVLGRGLYDEGDLVRFGGASTLRGYDEDRFRVRAALRGFAEARLHLDRESLAFLFADAGYVDQPEVPGRVAVRGFYPGYGIGIQLATPAGLLTTTYAASPETGLGNGRVHVGIRFGL